MSTAITIDLSESSGDLEDLPDIYLPSKSRYIKLTIKIM